MANGYVLYEGPSRLGDRANIVVIATGFGTRSKNVKTGSMIQTYILRSDVSPVVAVKTGADVAICGDCVHRGDGISGHGRTCYVNVGQGPYSVWRAWRAGRYPVLEGLNGGWELFRGRKVRLGSYGDPAAVSALLWANVVRYAAGWTGYTHQWRNSPALRHYCMASVDSPEEHGLAVALGWRTFRVALPGQDERLAKEVRCPASAEAGKRLKCETCLACSGGERSGSIVIQAHGGFAVMANIQKRAVAA